MSPKTNNNSGDTVGRAASGTANRRDAACPDDLPSTPAGRPAQCFGGNVLRGELDMASHRQNRPRRFPEDEFRDVAGLGHEEIAGRHALVAEHIDTAISRTATLGAVYLALVCLIPEMLVAYAQLPFYLGGTSLLLVVCTALDLDAQLKNGAHIRLGGQRP